MRNPELHFKITFDNKSQLPDWINPNEKAVMAKIKIGDFSESLVTPLDYWSRDDYVKQWKNALKVLISGEKASSAIITEMHNPIHANFIKCWVLYKEGKTVFIQNNILFLNELSEPFNIEHLDRYFSSRKSHTEEGEIISEWTASSEDLNMWLGSLEHLKS